VVEADLVGFLRRLYKKQVETILDVPSLGAGKSTKLTDCHLLELQFVKTLTLTGRCRYHPSATAGLRVHVRTSPHGGIFDSEDYTTFDLPFGAGEQHQKTVAVTPDMLYLKVIAENLDTGYDVYDVKVIATY